MLSHSQAQRKTVTRHVLRAIAAIALGIAIGLGKGPPQKALAATITVNSTADTAVAGDGECTLREALTNANDNTDSTGGDCASGAAGLDTITFKIPGAAPQTITITSALPVITEAVTLDATTQPSNGGAASNVCATENAPSYPRIRLHVDGVMNGLVFNYISGSSTVRGFSFTHDHNIGFDGAVRFQNGSGHRVECNHFGLTPEGDPGPDSWNVGVVIEGNSSGVIIGTNGDGLNDLAERNVFGDLNYGVYNNANDNNVIAGNYFGVGVTGTGDTANSYGVYARQYADHNRIGTNGDGTSDLLERNVFGHNTRAISFETDVSAPGNLVAGNWIGVDVNGSSAPNYFGIEIYGTSVDIQVGFDPGDDSVIREAMRNIIDNAVYDGILIADSADGTLIAGNTLSANDRGIAFTTNGTLNASSSNNCIAGNTTAGFFTNTTLASVPFENNWWGAANGPSGAGLGSGDAVSYSSTGTLDFDPWSADGRDCRAPGPPGPTLKKPADGSATKKIPKLQWNSVAGAVGYEVEIDDDRDFSSPEFSGPAPKNNLKPDVALDYGVYYWHVRANLGSGATAWSAVRVFTLTLLKNPADGSVFASGSSVAFRWNKDKIGHADSYRIEVDDDPNFGSVDYTYTGTKTKHTAPPASDGFWYWRVVPIRGGIDGTPTPAWQVIIGSP